MAPPDMEKSRDALATAELEEAIARLLAARAARRLKARRRLWRRR